MVLEDKTTYRNILGGLMKNPELFNHYPDIRPEDFFGLKLASTIFIVMYNMFMNGATKLSPEEIDLEIERHETLNVIYKENGGLDYLKFCYDTEIDNFSYYYKRLKKLALLHELRKNGYNIGKYYKEVFSSLREEEEAIQRFELATTDDILNEIEQNFATIKNEYVNRNKGGSAATGMTELVESFKLIPDIGPALEGDIYSTCCRGARAGKFYLRSAGQGTGKTRMAVFDACKLCYPIKWSFEDKAFVVEQREGKNREPIKVLVITTEMGRDEIQTIILSYLSGVNERKILTGSYDDEEWERIQYAIKITDDYKQYFFLEEIPDPNLTNVEALIKKYIVIEHIQACMYDYIFTSPSLIGQFQNAKMREDSALQLMANKLKEIATTYNIYVQSSTQLNAEGMTREGFKDGTCLRGR